MTPPSRTSSHTNMPTYPTLPAMLCQILLLLHTQSTTIVAKTWYVGPNNQGSDNFTNLETTSTTPLSTIQHAVYRAQPGDIVTLRVGTHSGGPACDTLDAATRRCNHNIDLLGKPILVEGLPGAAPSTVIVDCGLSEWPDRPTRGFVFQSSETNTTVLRRMTIRRCRALRGVRPESCHNDLSWSSPPLSRGLFPFVRGHVGGAIAIIKSSPLFIDLIIEDCQAGLGGGIYVGGGDSGGSSGSGLTLHDVDVFSSTAASGGAIFVDDSEAYWKGGALDGNGVDAGAGPHESCAEALEIAMRGDSKQDVEPGHVVQRFRQQGSGGFGHGTADGIDFLFLNSKQDAKTTVYNDFET